MEFKDRLKIVRNENDVSAVELAKYLGKSESAIRMWEAGKTKPDADTLIELSKMFDCSTDYLLGLSEFKNIETEQEMKSILSNIELNISKIQGDLKFDFCHELNDFFEGVQKLRDMPILSAPNIQKVHLKVATSVLRLLADTSTVIAISEDLQRNGFISDGISTEERQERVQDIKQIVDASYKTIDSIVPTFMNLAIKTNDDCTKFLDFMYKGIINGKPTVITTISELLGLSKKIKKTRL